MTFQRQVTVRINDVYNLVTNKRIFDFVVGGIGIVGCRKKFRSTPLVNNPVSVPLSTLLYIWLDSIFDRELHKVNHCRIT
jgi:hypothetical protein